MNSDRTLWYREPAELWSEALPLGNGSMGAMVYGGVASERLLLSESSCFSGEKSDENNVEDHGRVVEDIRQALLQDEYDRAEALCGKIIGRKLNYGTNLPVGALTIDFDEDLSASEYRRQLDLSKAVSTITYEGRDVGFRREYFISNPDQVLVCHLTTDSNQAITCAVRIDGGENPCEVHSDNTGDLHLSGYAHESKHSDGKTGVGYHCRICCLVDGGLISYDGSDLVIERADSVQILLAIATDFSREDPSKTCKSRIDEASRFSFDELEERHIHDYANLFDRVDLQLSSSDGPSMENIPTDARLESVKNGKADTGLAALMFQYGRYLLISSSRKNSLLPAHLQGAWNDDVACRIGWTCDMHLDINTQMNYWPVEVTNLAECSAPLHSWIADVLVPSGRRTAEKLYGLDGWVAHIVSNAWGFSAPGWSTRWGLHVTGGAWIAMHLWDHYAFGLDREFLEKAAYPVLREASVFFLDYLIDDLNTGYLLSGPSCSPENVFCHDGQVYSNSLGTTCDNVIIRALFSACIAASEILEIEDEHILRLRNAVPRLPPLTIAVDGRLQEWLYDYEESGSQHRHTSHLLALYPFNEICPESTPELARAAQASIDGRMTPKETWEDTGWARSMLMLYAARLRDGDEAWEHILDMQRTLTEPNLMVFHPPVAGAHTPVYELDGNTGLCACVAEMLLQSHRGTIHLLPSLPASWESGKVKGLRGRGGYTVDISWRNGILESCSIHTTIDGYCLVQYRDRKKRINVVSGRTITLVGEDLFDAEQSRE